jgi:Glycosyl hydrolases family 2, TIM barrel domain/Glycosyl hydrolases family 2/Glycosyl hydrolases family 2, sugar binding domain/Beta galactosidase small chain
LNSNREPREIREQKNFFICFAYFAVQIFFFCQFSFAQQTEIQFLSGHGKDDDVPWKFFCTANANSGFWTNLPVPSCWELHGFGKINYHRDATNSYDERGLYETEFSVSESWRGKRIFLVFDGSMTDTSAKLNGQSCGPTHQGAYYCFKYEVTSLVNFDAANKLEVEVAKHSANNSVNGAERTGDYWMYGGIFRPVYLETVPQNFIERVAIDAQADGNFSAQVLLNGLTNASEVEAQIQTLDGKNIGKPVSAGIIYGGARPDMASLKTKISAPKLWTAETPNLYKAIFRLKQNGKVIHEVSQRFGFRTFEVRDGDGLYLNGKRIILKGCDRHSFWPDSGRCLSDAVQRLDIETIKDMNMNAVRMSHYPPDAEFLDLCDEKGLYVLDELTGWHKFYDTETGTKLVKEMVTRDANHPSILFWDNGNEGGFNTNLDNIFGQYDLQNRRVLHPWSPFNGVNTVHYLPYDKAKIACDGIALAYHKNDYDTWTNSNQKWIYMPTEFIHGLYDGGAGAGLADTWDLMSQSKYIGGGFIWAFLDEGIKRADTGEIDVSGNEAPDGIVGPYREREASFYTIKQIWSPLQILETNLPENFDGKLTVENHYNFTDARACKFTWQLRRFVFPNHEIASEEFIAAEGTATVASIPPSGHGKLKLNLPENFRHLADVTEGDFLAVRMEDPSGRELWTYVWPLRQRKILSDEAHVIATADYSGTNTGIMELKGAGVVARIENGELISVERDGKKFSLSNGPRAAATNSVLKKISWQLRADGWLRCDYTYIADGTNDYFGVVFDYPENLVKSKRWLGDGPYRVWQNRRAGVTTGVWQNDYNNTITGWRGWIYPEFKGFFANVRWLQLQTSEGEITVVNDSQIPFMQVLTPEFPPAKLAGNTIVNLPTCGLGFLDTIPAMGSKFQRASAVSPSGVAAVAHGQFHSAVDFHFEPQPK